MNKKGFTLVELLATLVVLGIIMGIVIISTNGGFDNAKNTTEDIFVGTIEDALNIYLDSDARKLSFSTEAICQVDKTHKNNVKIYKNSTVVTFDDVINSSYSPITANDMHNPANKDTDKYQCNTNGILNIYRDEDYVYYYRIDKSEFGCLNKTGVITNLPSTCNG